jgi:hypothetical protein
VIFFIDSLNSDFNALEFIFTKVVVYLANLPYHALGLLVHLLPLLRSFSKLAKYCQETNLWSWFWMLSIARSEKEIPIFHFWFSMCSPKYRRMIKDLYSIYGL